jgi:hypothetical protein
MKYLVDCPCGHNLELHDRPGCSGERGLPCPCPLDAARALAAAIERARIDAAQAWRRPNDPQSGIATG